MKLNLFSRLELAVLNYTIRVLSSPSLPRQTLCKVYQLSSGSQVSSLGLLVGASGLAGLVSGYMFYFLVSILR